MVIAKLSSSVRILGKVITIRPFKDTLLVSHAAGANDVKQGIIEYDMLQTVDQLKDTILHEIIHIIDYEMQLEMSERQVHCMATGLYSVLKDNGDLAKWIIKK